MRKRVGTIIGASIFGMFHLLAVVLPSATSMVSGEAGFYILILDYPLYLLLRHPLESYTETFMMLYFYVAGTLMYAVVGAALGYMCDKIRVYK